MESERGGRLPLQSGEERKGTAVPSPPPFFLGMLTSANPRRQPRHLLRPPRFILGKSPPHCLFSRRQALKFIPWGGVAAHLRRNGRSTATSTGAAPGGKAFCFLPLPVSTGLPVHVNGYFELSSNRRDVWHGGDMAGEGRRRSEWNSALLSDAVRHMKQECGETLSKSPPPKL